MPHVECAQLLQLGVQLCGCNLASMSAMRLAAPVPPLLTVDEEHSLALALRSQPSSQPRLQEDVSNEAECTCMICALLSGWPSLEKETLQALSSRVLNATLLTLLIRRGWLPRIVGTECWRRALFVMCELSSDELSRGAIAALGRVRMHGRAGEITLLRTRCHPALHSAFACHCCCSPSGFSSAVRAAARSSVRILSDLTCRTREGPCR